MKKIFILQLLFLIGLMTTLNSCRTDEATNTTEEAQKEKIAFFESFEKNLAFSKSTEINYAYPFAQCIEYYFENNPKTQEFFNTKYGYLDRKVSTQSIDGDEGEKLIFFPVLDGNRKVTAILAGVVNGKRDYLYYDVWVNEHPDVLYIISRFQEYYDSLAKGRSDTTEIDEIVITVTRPVKLINYDIWTGPGNGNGGQDGGHLASGGNGDFGGGINNPPVTTNPCEQTKKVINNPKSKPIIDSLKQQSTLGGEKGAKFKTDGTPSDIIPGGAHEVDLGDTTGYQGGYHNHTPTGIKMFSPPDIIKLLNFAIAQPNGNIRNGFMGMIGSEPCNSCSGGVRYYHYMINFNGTAQELSGFLYNSNWNFRDLIDTYRDRENELSGNSIFSNNGTTLNEKGLEKLFFDTLKNMGMEGKVNLQKIEDNGTVENITLNSTGSSTISTPCP